MLLVKDIMTHSPKVCGLEDSLSYLAMMMWNYNVGSIPVVDESFQPLGMVTDRDIAMNVVLTGKMLSQLRVYGVILEQQPVVCSESETVDTALALMSIRQVRRIMIVDKSQKLTGIISIADILSNKIIESPSKSRAHYLASFANTMIGVTRDKHKENISEKSSKVLSYK